MNKKESIAYIQFKNQINSIIITLMSQEGNQTSQNIEALKLSAQSIHLQDNGLQQAQSQDHLPPQQTDIIESLSERLPTKDVISSRKIETTEQNDQSIVDGEHQESQRTFQSLQPRQQDQQTNKLEKIPNYQSLKQVSSPFAINNFMDDKKALFSQSCRFSQNSFNKAPRIIANSKVNLNNQESKIKSFRGFSLQKSKLQNKVKQKLQTLKLEEQPIQKEDEKEETIQQIQARLNKQMEASEVNDSKAEQGSDSFYKSIDNNNTNILKKLKEENSQSEDEFLNKDFFSSISKSNNQVSVNKVVDKQRSTDGIPKNQTSYLTSPLKEMYNNQSAHLGILEEVPSVTVHNKKEEGRMYTDLIQEFKEAKGDTAQSSLVPIKSLDVEAQSPQTKISQTKIKNPLSESQNFLLRINNLLNSQRIKLQSQIQAQQQIEQVKFESFMDEFVNQKNKKKEKIQEQLNKEERNHQREVDEAEKELISQRDKEIEIIKKHYEMKVNQKKTRMSEEFAQQKKQKTKKLKRIDKKQKGYMKVLQLKKDQKLQKINESLQKNLESNEMFLKDLLSTAERQVRNEIEKLEETQECSICLLDIQFDLIMGKCVDLKCGHIFHALCIEKWEQTKIESQCPICRKKIEYKDEERLERRRERKRQKRLRNQVRGEFQERFRFRRAEGPYILNNNAALGNNSLDSRQAQRERRNWNHRLNDIIRGDNSLMDNNHQSNLNELDFFDEQRNRQRRRDVENEQFFDHLGIRPYPGQLRNAINQNNNDSRSQSGESLDTELQNIRRRINQRSQQQNRNQEDSDPLLQRINEEKDNDDSSSESRSIGDYSSSSSSSDQNDNQNQNIRPSNQQNRSNIGLNLQSVGRNNNPLIDFDNFASRIQLSPRRERVNLRPTVERTQQRHAQNGSNDGNQSRLQRNRNDDNFHFYHDEDDDVIRINNRVRVRDEDLPHSIFEEQPVEDLLGQQSRANTFSYQPRFDPVQNNFEQSSSELDRRFRSDQNRKEEEQRKIRASDFLKFLENQNMDSLNARANSQRASNQQDKSDERFRELADDDQDSEKSDERLNRFRGLQPIYEEEKSDSADGMLSRADYDFSHRVNIRPLHGYSESKSSTNGHSSDRNDNENTVTRRSSTDNSDVSTKNLRTLSNVSSTKTGKKMHENGRDYTGQIARIKALRFKDKGSTKVKRSNRPSKEQGPQQIRDFSLASSQKTQSISYQRSKSDRTDNEEEEDSVKNVQRKYLDSINKTRDNIAQQRNRPKNRRVSRLKSHLGKLSEKVECLNDLYQYKRRKSEEKSKSSGYSISTKGKQNEEEIRDELDQALKGLSQRERSINRKWWHTLDDQEVSSSKSKKIDNVDEKSDEDYMGNRSFDRSSTESLSQKRTKAVTRDKVNYSLHNYQEELNNLNKEEERRQRLDLNISRKLQRIQKMEEQQEIIQRIARSDLNDLYSSEKEDESCKNSSEPTSQARKLESSFQRQLKEIRETEKDYLKGDYLNDKRFSLQNNSDVSSKKDESSVSQSQRDHRDNQSEKDTLKNFNRSQQSDDSTLLRQKSQESGEHSKGKDSIKEEQGDRARSEKERQNIEQMMDEICGGTRSQAKPSDLDGKERDIQDLKEDVHENIE